MPEDSWKERLKRAADGWNDYAIGKAQSVGARLRQNDTVRAFGEGVGRRFESAQGAVQAQPAVQAADRGLEAVDSGTIGKAIRRVSGIDAKREQIAMAEKQRQVEEQIAQLLEIQRQAQLREQAKREALAKGHQDLGEVEEWPEYAQQYPPIELDQAPQGPGRQPVGFHRGW